MKKEKGITLIALVVIIIVLIILAGVSINLVLGNNGIIAKTQLAKIASINAQIQKEISLKDYESEIENASIVSNRANGNVLLDYGIATILSGSSWRTIYVPFNKSYSTNPIVVTQQMQTDTDIESLESPIGGCSQYEVDNVTTEGFYIRLYNGNYQDVPINLYWIAIGN